MNHSKIRVRQNGAHDGCRIHDCSLITVKMPQIISSYPRTWDLAVSSFHSIDTAGCYCQLFGIQNYTGRLPVNQLAAHSCRQLCFHCQDLVELRIDQLHTGMRQTRKCIHSKVNIHTYSSVKYYLKRHAVSINWGLDIMIDQLNCTKILFLTLS